MFELKYQLLCISDFNIFHPSPIHAVAEKSQEPVVDLLYDAKALVAEGPFYEQETNQLLWVDIEGHTVNFLNVASGENRALKLPDTTSAVFPVEGSDKLLVLVGRKICLVDRETGVTEELATVDEDKSKNRFNDAKCDRHGRLWCGTMGSETKPLFISPGQGSLYCYAGGKVAKQVPGITISNGIDWNRDNTAMYYIDSAPQEVHVFDYNEHEGTISNQQIFIDFAKDRSLGFPDGMCVDTQGRLWIAGFFGQAVTCWDPKTGEKIREIPIPGKRVTSCCFGGPDFDWLFVTTACYTASEEELLKFPHSGGIFVVKGLGVRGRPAHRFRQSGQSAAML